MLSEDANLHLVGHAGGAHESELWGLRADLYDAFADAARRTTRCSKSSFSRYKLGTGETS